MLDQVTLTIDGREVAVPAVWASDGNVSVMAAVKTAVATIRIGI